MNENLLICTDDSAFPQNFISGYEKNGITPFVGTKNFFLDCGAAAYTHFFWPEEMCDWSLPSRSQISRLSSMLERRSESSKIIQSVNNLRPHESGDNQIWKELYQLFYRHAAVIHHFSRISKEIVCREFPDTQSANHVIHTGIDYTKIQEFRTVSREAARKRFGLKDDECVFLIFGAIRSMQELELIRSAWKRSQAKNKKLLFAGRLNLRQASKLKMKVAQKTLRAALWELKAYNHSEFIPESEVPEIFDAADATIVLRQNSLSSGIPCLAMTLGKYVIVPRLNAMEEYVEGTENGLYSPGSAEDLAGAIDLATKTNLKAIGMKNITHSKQWNWQMGALKVLNAAKNT